MNFHLGLRFHVTGRGSVVARVLIYALLPLALVMQGVTNLLALALDLFDRTSAFPLAVVALARKPREG